MKKLYFSTLLIAGCLTGLMAQTPSFEIKNKTGGTAVVTNNEIFYHTTTALSTTEHSFDMKNISAATITLTVRKYDDQVNTVNASDMAAAYFCTGTTCYNPGVYTASVTLAPNEVMEFKGYLEEASQIGQSSIRYKFSSGSDILFTELKYNIASSVKSNTAFFGNASSVYPNPASSKAFINVSTNESANVNLSVINALGSTVMTKNVAVNHGKNVVVIDTETLESGIYFVTMTYGSAVITRKITITK